MLKHFLQTPPKAHQPPERDPADIGHWIRGLTPEQLRAACTWEATRGHTKDTFQLQQKAQKAGGRKRTRLRGLAKMIDMQGSRASQESDDYDHYAAQMAQKLKLSGLKWSYLGRSNLEGTCRAAQRALVVGGRGLPKGTIERVLARYDEAVAAVELYDEIGEDVFVLLCELSDQQVAAAKESGVGGPSLEDLRRVVLGAVSEPLVDVTNATADVETTVAA